VDKLTHYRVLIKRLLSQYAELINQHPKPDLDVDVAFDEEHDHYMLLKMGWTPQGRVRGATLHVRLRAGKFWIEEDWTEEGIATDLLQAGVPNEDIVLAFQPPEMRPYTEFATA